jgi:hypothetical protein
LTAEALREHLLPGPIHSGAHKEGSASQPVTSLPIEERPLTEKSDALKPNLAPPAVHREPEDTRASEGLATNPREGDDRALTVD